MGEIPNCRGDQVKSIIPSQFSKKICCDVGFSEGVSYLNLLASSQTPRHDADGLDLLATTAVSPAVAPPNEETWTDILVIIILDKKEYCGTEISELATHESSSSGVVVAPDHLSMELPKDYQFQICLRVKQRTQAEDTNSGNDGTVEPITSKLITFQLPEDIYQSIEKMDKESSATSGYLSLAERVEGWTITKAKIISCKRSDKTFKHSKSGKTFCSFAESKTYIVYAGRKHHI